MMMRVHRLQELGMWPTDHPSCHVPISTFHCVVTCNPQTLQTDRQTSTRSIIVTGDARMSSGCGLQCKHPSIGLHVHVLLLLNSLQNTDNAADFANPLRIREQKKLQANFGRLRPMSPWPGVLPLEWPRCICMGLTHPQIRVTGARSMRQPCIQCFIKLYFLTAELKSEVQWECRVPNSCLIDRVAGEIIRLLASVCVYPFVCGRSPVWTVWPLTLIFVMRVDLDLS